MSKHLFHKYHLITITLDIDHHISEIGEFPEKELLMESEVSELCEVLSCSPKLLPDLLKKHLTNNSWSGMERLSKALKSPLMRLCARYLYSEKRRGFALNPVGKL